MDPRTNLLGRDAANPNINWGYRCWTLRARHVRETFAHA